MAAVNSTTLGGRGEGFSGSIPPFALIDKTCRMPPWIPLVSGIRRHPRAATPCCPRWHSLFLPSTLTGANGLRNRGTRDADSDGSGVSRDLTDWNQVSYGKSSAGCRAAAAGGSAPAGRSLGPPLDMPAGQPGRCSGACSLGFEEILAMISRRS